MNIDYADVWAYPDRIEIRKRGEVVESIPVDHPEDEAWHDFVAHKAAPVIHQKGYRCDSWHRPRDNAELLATTFAWREPTR